jgi:disulfide bond formation protein DsbB
MNIRSLLAPRTLLLSTTIISVGALSAAFASEAFLKLEPCPLCIMQRWPYVVAALLGVIGLSTQSRPRISLYAVILSGLAFLVNSGIALYHTGVERHWWESFLQGCVVPPFGDEPSSILKNIMSAPTGRCDEIPWADPLLGLSMANYNVVLCFALFIVCALCARKNLLAKY